MPAQARTTTKRPKGPDAFRRALEHSRAIWTAAAVVEELPFGLALNQPLAPRVRDLNQILLNRPAPDLPADALAAVMRRLGCEQVDVWDPATAERLLSRLEPRGWSEQRFTLLAAPHETDLTRFTDVDEADPTELADLRREWLLEHEFFRSDPELVAQILDADRLLAAATPTGGFCVRRAGRPVAMALLMGGRDGTAMIEDVYTTPALRGERLGAAVVRAAERAGREAGCDLVYLPTDADGLAQLFYRKLGYTPLGVVSRFVTS